MTVVSGDGFFGLQPTQSQITRQSNRVMVNARALPAGAPAGFNGVVGQIDFEAKLEPPLARGRPGRHPRAQALRQRSPARASAAPEVPAPAGVTVFPPQQSGGDTVSKKRWSAIGCGATCWCPTAPAKSPCPALEIPYFDPAAGRYAVRRPPSPRARGQRIDPGGARRRRQRSRSTRSAPTPCRPRRWPCRTGPGGRFCC